jgi:hypothetical protein
MSRIETTQYLRKPLYVAAVRVTDANFNDIAEWCQGEILVEGASNWKLGEQQRETTRHYIHVRVHNPKSPRQTKAFVGDWLLYTERGYKVYTNRAFHESFDEAGNEATSYPRDEGDMIVLGPECFAHQDGSVLCWKGVNYTPQITHEDVYMGSEELMPGMTVNEALTKVRQNGALVNGNGQTE